MPGVDLSKVYTDPDFTALSDQDKKAVLAELGYGGTMAGGLGASMRAAGPEDAQSGWSKAREAISRALFGDEDRAAAAEAGIGLQPTPSEMVTGVAEPALMALGSTAGLTKGIPGAVGGIRAGLGAAARSLGVSTAGATGATIGGSVGAKVGHEVGFPTAGAVAGTLIGGALGGKVAAGRAAGKAVIKPIPNAVSPIKVATEEAARKAHMARVAATEAKMAAEAAKKATPVAEVVSAEKIAAHGTPKYAYHGTTTERLADIVHDGKLRTFKPNYGTDQAAWPDGATSKRAYFSSNAKTVESFTPEGGRPVVLRVKADSRFLTERGTGDLYSSNPIPAKELEFLTPAGEWKPVVQVVKKAAPSVAKAKKAKLPSVEVTKPPNAIVAEAQKFEGEIVNLRMEEGQSGAQIVNALKRYHKIPPGKGQQMVDLVLEKHGIKSLKPAAGEIKIVPRADPVVMAQRAFAKEATPGGSFGDKVWLLIEDGKPAKVLTYGQAGAAGRAGKETTYIINTWGS